MFLQTKNGPLDFQAREPFHPMFGRMENTNQAIELQITQEYTGQSKMLTYLAPMWEEVLKTDTARRPGARRQRRRRRRRHARATPTPPSSASPTSATPTT